MLKTLLAPALVVGALILPLSACNSTSDSTDGLPPSTEMLDGVGDRAEFTEVTVPEGDGAVGADPTAVALATFGSTEPGEGNFEETVELVEETDDQALVLLTQTGLADDSVNGMRYRLEFVPEGDQWRLDWAGSQVRCQPGRGSEEWGTELCI